MNKKRIRNKQFKGFTIVELIIIIIIIGILASISIVYYGNAQTRIRDDSVQSDLSALKAGVKDYINFHNQPPATVADLSFTPSEGNEIDYVVDGSNYCIRGYNPGGTYNSIFNSYTEESGPGVCDELGPSD